MPDSLEDSDMGSLCNLVMPKLGLTMTEGSIVEWKVEPGQAFRKGQVLVVIETEKITFEVESESNGMMVDIVMVAGKTAPVGAVIANWRNMDMSASEKVCSQSYITEDSGPYGERSVTEDAPPVLVDADVSSVATSQRIVSTPLARRIAKQLRVELSTVKGSGPSGRIKARDVEATASYSGTHSITSAGVGVDIITPFDKGVRAPVDGVQATMARRLTEVKKEVPHFYLSSEAEVSALITLRHSLNEHAGLPKITINHFVLGAVGRTLLDLPHANKVWADGDLITYQSPDVGLAVDTSRGLFVPILRGAGWIGLNDVASRASLLVAKAREGRLLPEDVSGGAITVSNAGMFNVSYLTPIINPGHSAILGVGSLRRLFRPDDDGKPKLKQEIGLVLACDHRVFTGVAGLEILNQVISYLENPISLLGNQSDQVKRHDSRAEE